MYVCIRVYKISCMYVRMYIYMHACMHECMYVRMSACLCVCVSVCLCVSRYLVLPYEGYLRDIILNLASCAPAGYSSKVVVNIVVK